VGVSHGWTPDGDPMFISHTRGGTILTLDNQPALDRYLDRCGAPADAATCPVAFARWADGHPLGIRRSRGRVHVRRVISADFASRALQAQLPVAQGGLISALRGDGDPPLHATDTACADALAALDGAAPTGLIAFNCMDHAVAVLALG